MHAIQVNDTPYFTSSNNWAASAAGKCDATGLARCAWCLFPLAPKLAWQSSVLPYLFFKPLL